MLINSDYLHHHHIDFPFISENTFNSIKDLDNRIVGVTSALSGLLGFSKTDDLIKTPLYDVELPCKTSLLSKYYVDQDKKSSVSATSIQSLGFSFFAKDELRIILSEKTPFYNKLGEVIGYWCNGIDVTKTNIINIHAVIEKLHPNQIIEGQFSIILTANYASLDLSVRQSECLYYLLRGYSYIEIGNRLNISFRTVETHLDYIKTKMGCANKKQIIEKAIIQGYLSIFPQSILSHK